MLKNVAIGVFVTLGVISIAGFIAGVGGAYLRIFGPEIGFGLFAVGMLTGVIVVIAGIGDLAKNGATWRSAFLIAALIPVGALVYGIIESRNYPAINDVTTNTAIPPAYVHAKTLPENEGRDMKFPREFEPVIEEHYSDLEPQIATQSIDSVHTKVIEVIDGLSAWTLDSTEVTPATIRIEGTITSEVFGFVDDYVIVLTKPGSGGCVVDMRSKSRLGKSDFGQNAAHIRQFFDLIDL